MFQADYGRQKLWMEYITENIIEKPLSTRWNSTLVMIDCIVKHYDDVLDLLNAKQKLRNEDNVNNGLKNDQVIIDLLNVLDMRDLKNISTFLRPFKVIFIYLNYFYCV